MTYSKDPRVGRVVRLRHVKGESGVPRALDGIRARVTAVWKYHSGLVRIHLKIDEPRYPDDHRTLTCSVRQVDFGRPA